MSFEVSVILSIILLYFVNKIFYIFQTCVESICMKINLYFCSLQHFCTVLLNFFWALFVLLLIQCKTPIQKSNVNSRGNCESKGCLVNLVWLFCVIGSFSQWPKTQYINKMREREGASEGHHTTAASGLLLRRLYQ